MLTPIQVRTLQQFLESEQTIDCDCSNYWSCTHSGPLRLELAIQRLGWSFDFYAGREILARRVYCSLCGRRQPTFRLGWKTRPQTYTGTHGAGMDVISVLDVPKRTMAVHWVEPSDWRRGGSSVRTFGPRK